MCMNVIIDANVAGELIRSEEQGDGQLLREWIEQGHGTVVYSGSREYRREIRPGTRIFRLFEQYRKSGRARRIDTSRMRRSEKLIDQAGMKSDDLYALALALASDALVLYSNDDDLKGDFTNRKLLPKVGRKDRAVYPARDTRSKKRKFLNRRHCSRN